MSSPVFEQVKNFVGLYRQRSRRHLRLAVVMSVGLAVFDFASLLLLYPIFGNLTSSVSTTQLPLVPQMDVSTLILMAMGMMIGRSIFGFCVRLWWTAKASEAEVELSARLLQAYAFAPYSFHLRRNSSDLLARSVSHVNMASTSGLQGLVTLSTDVASVLAMCSALLVASPVSSIVVLAYLGVLGGAFAAVSRRRVAGHSVRFAAEVGRVYAHASTLLRGIRELTVAGARQTALDRVQSSRSIMVRAQRSMVVIAEVPKMVLEVALYLAVLVAILIVASSDDRESALPVVALYVVAGLRILPAIARALGTLTQVRTGLELGKQVSSELDEVEKHGQQTTRPAGSLPRLATLSMRGLAFTYDGQSNVFEDIDLAVPFGSTLAIVGESGSGKSTLLGLLLGLLAPTSGHITYGEADIGVADSAWLSRIGYVPQHVYITDDDVLSNVALGDPAPDLVRVRESLRAAKLLGVVETMEDGVHTLLGEEGNRLSVGQKQRLGIARAWYRQPEILILDEPTSALDNDTEEAVMASVRELAGQVTTIIVAHRLSTIMHADSVLTLQSGRGSVKQ
ncbi:MAG: ABC transporter ATP-binding protein [Candidatus Nanopelagicales bacterium]